MNQERICTDCGGTIFVEDHAAGDLVCRGCGLVAEAHLIDERSEWRTFSDTDKAGSDPNRVGGAFNSLLSDGGLSTSIGQTRGDAGMSHTLNRLHARSTASDRNMMSAIKSIGGMVERLNLVSNVKDVALEIFKEVTEKKNMKGRGVQAIYAACIYVACRQENIRRTFKEICTVVTDANKKDIGRCYKTIVQMQQENNQSKAEAGIAVAPSGLAPSMHPAQFMRRFCTQLGLNHQDIKACTEMANLAKPEGEEDNLLKPWHGKNPLSIAAAIIFAIMQIKAEHQAKESGKPAERVPMQNIVVVTGMAEATIRTCYRDLYTEMDSLIPKWYLADIDWRDKLVNPEGKYTPAGKV